MNNKKFVFISILIVVVVVIGATLIYVSDEDSNDPVIDLKINNTDTPESVEYGKEFDISWTSSNVSECQSYGDIVSVPRGTGEDHKSDWNRVKDIPKKGKETLYAINDEEKEYGSTRELIIGIKCSTATGEFITDEIILSVFNLHSIVLLSPNGGESFKEGDVMRIEWEASENIKDFMISGTVMGTILFPSWHPFSDLSASDIPELQSQTIHNTLNTSFFNWTVTTSNPGNRVKQGRIEILGYNELGELVAEDTSDDLFSVEFFRR